MKAIVIPHIVVARFCVGRLALSGWCLGSVIVCVPALMVARSCRVGVEDEVPMLVDQL